MKRNFAINEAYMEIARKNDSYAAYQKECFDKGHYNMEEIDRHWDLKKHGFSFQSVMKEVFVKNQDKNKVFYVTKDNDGNYLIAAKNGEEKFLWRFDNKQNHSLYRFHKWVGDDTVVIINFLSNGGVRFYQERVKTGENIVLHIIEKEKGVKFLYNGGLSEKEAEDYKKKIEKYNKDAEPEDFNSVVGFLKQGGFVEIEEKNANFSCGSKKNFSLYTLVDFEKGDKVITDHDDRVQEIVEVTVDSHGNKKFKLSQATGLWSADQLSPADKKAKGWIEIRPNVWWCGESDDKEDYCWLFFKNKQYVHFPFDYVSQEGVEISFTEGIMDAQSIVERSNKAIDFEKLANDVDNWTKNFSISKEGFHFPNTNITFFGTKYDTNGNKVFVLQVGGYRKFSIQTNLIDERKSFNVNKGEDLENWIIDNFGSIDNFKEKLINRLKFMYNETKNKKYYPYDRSEDFDDDGFAEMMRSHILDKCREVHRKILDGRKREIQDFDVDVTGMGCYNLENKNKMHILQGIYITPKRIDIQLVNTKGKIQAYKLTPKGIPNWDELYDEIENWEKNNDKMAFDTHFSIFSEKEEDDDDTLTYYF